LGSVQAKKLAYADSTILHLVRGVVDLASFARQEALP
jgi:hypothetical protein